MAGPPRFVANGVPKSRRKSCPPENGRTSFAACEFFLLSEGRISVDSQLSASSLPFSSSMQRVEARRVDQAHTSQNMRNGGLSRCSRARSFTSRAGARRTYDCLKQPGTTYVSYDCYTALEITLLDVRLSGSQGPSIPFLRLLAGLGAVYVGALQLPCAAGLRRLLAISSSFRLTPTRHHLVRKNV